jgi:hypothetical protein
MSVTAVATPIGDRPASTTLRLALVAIAIAVLLAASFVVGRVTASSTSNGTTSIVPAAHTSGAVDSCPRARFC